MNNNWFKHDVDASNHPKIVALIESQGGIAYAFWWKVVETLHKKEGEPIPDKKYEILAIASSLKISQQQAVEIINEMVEMELLIKTDEGYFNERVLDQIHQLNKTRELRSKAGKKSAASKIKENKHNLNKSSTGVEQVLNKSSTGVEQNSTDKTRLEKTRLNKSEKENIKEKPASSLPASPEVNIYDHPVLNWIDQNTPRLKKMKEPLTAEQAETLVANHDPAIIAEIFAAMHNYEPLLKKNRSTYLTALNWIKRRNEKAQSNNNRPLNNGQAFERFYHEQRNAAFSK